MELRLLDFKKIHGIPNLNMPLIIVVTIADRNLTRFLIDDEHSCNVLYAHTMDLLGI